MEGKTFVVRNPKTKKEFTIQGTSLSNALKVNCLDPSSWRPVKEPPPPTKENFGDNS